MCNKIIRQALVTEGSRSSVRHTCPSLDLYALRCPMGPTFLQSRALRKVLQARHFTAHLAPLLLRREWPDKALLAETAPPGHYVEQLEHLVAKARQVPPNVPRGPTRRPNEAGDMPCRLCGQYLSPDMFSSATACRLCGAARARRYQRTLRGSSSVLASAANSRSRLKGLPCNLKKEDILDMLLYQKGRCAYSGIPMEIVHPNSNWRMSLERLDNRSGYNIENCVLVAAEFNSGDSSQHPGVNQEGVDGTAQWHVRKIRMVDLALDLEVDMHQLEEDVRLARCRNARALALQTCRAVGAQMQGLRARSKILVNSARKNSRRRGHQCDIDYEHVLDLLLGQGGRCFYSGVPLQYKRGHTDWVMSLERLNNSSGYAPGNCVLIALEFNTTDHSKHAVGEVHGSSQWSLAKMMHIWRRAGFLKPPLHSAWGNPFPQAAFQLE